MTANKRERKAARVYTPPSGHHIRYRPNWHRAAGLAVRIVGLGVVTVNLLTEFTKTGLLPAANRCCTRWPASWSPAPACGGSAGRSPDLAPR
jgi:hypothetical protein